MLRISIIGVLIFLIFGQNKYVNATSPIRSWATDMYNQVSVKSFSENNFLTFPVGSVTTDGLIIRSDGINNEYGKNLPWNDFEKDGFRYNPELTPKNPISKTELSISNGKYLYNVNCAACHGINADGGTNISRMRAVPIIKDLISDFSEGYIYMRITYGGSILTSMPPLEYALSESERWDVINYIKTTFK